MTLQEFNSALKAMKSSPDTVSKSTLKRYHAKKNSVKPHNKNLQNLTLQMDDFLPLGGIFGLFRLNEFWRLASILDFIVKNIFLN